jgi:hypothetical protein
MKYISGFASKVGFYLFCAVVFAWTASLTVSFVGQVMPGSAIAPFFALGVFDGGALVWLVVMLSLAQGVGQRTVALLMMVFDLLGVALMSVSELFLGGQTFAVAPANLGEIAVWAIGLWTFANLASAFLYHVLDPKMQEQITIGVAKDKITTAGLKELEKDLDVLGPELGRELGTRLKAQILLEMGLDEKPVAQLLPVVDMARQNGKYKRVEIGEENQNSKNGGSLA